MILEPSTPPANTTGPDHGTSPDPSTAPPIATAGDAGAKTADSLQVALVEGGMAPGTCRSHARDNRQYNPPMRKNNVVHIDSGADPAYLSIMNITPSEVIRQAIQEDGRSLREIAAASGIDNGQLSRFMRKQRGLSTATLDLLCPALGLRVVLVKIKKSEHERKGG